MGVYVDVRDEDNHTPLHIASSNGYIWLIDLLLSYGADVNAKDNNLMTPLMHSCIFGSIEIVDLLISRGARMDDKSFHNINLITFAAYYGHLELIKYLQKFNLPLDDNAEENCMVSTLVAACASGNVSTIIYLSLLGDVDVNRRIGCLNNMSALDYCILNDKIETGNLLIELGADVDMISFNNGTPRELVKKFNRKNLTDELVFNSITQDKLLPVTPEHMKKDRRRKKVDLRVLIRDEEIYEINELFSGNRQSETLPESHNTIMYAAIIGNIVIAEKFIKLGVDINKSEPVLGFTPIMLAASCGNDEMVQYLMSKGSYINVSSKNNITLYDLMVLSKGISKETICIYDNYKSTGTFHNEYVDKKDGLWKKLGSYFKSPKKKCHINVYPGSVAIKERVYDNMEKVDMFNEEFFRQFELERIPVESDTKWFNIDDCNIDLIGNCNLKVYEEPINRSSLILDRISCEKYSTIFYHGSDIVSMLTAFSIEDKKAQLRELIAHYSNVNVSKKVDRNERKEKTVSVASLEGNEADFVEENGEILDFLVDAAFTMLEDLDIP
uniref:ANK_REP_REGION domain-containing protein n=1 Tax=Parastrongyloides trichosuri TaxID=131310 RepID=A0A0N4Z584_PARTI